MGARDIGLHSGIPSWVAAAGFVLLVPVDTPQAAQWDTGAGLTLGAVYSDNVCLRNVDEENKAIGTATPNVRVSADGVNGSMDLFAAVEFNTLENSSLDCNAQGTEALSPAPRVRFNGNTTLVPQWLYLDATAFADQNPINQFVAGSEDNLSGRGNVNTTYQYRVSPYLYRQLSATTSALLRATYSEEVNTEDAVSDSEREQVYLDVGSSPELSQFSVGVVGQYSNIDYSRERSGDRTFNSELSSAQLRAAYQLSRQWQVNGYVGEEWNDYISVFQEEEGSYWDVGLIWTPNKRVTIAAGTGERFFGSTPRASVDYRYRSGRISLSYERELTYDRSLRGTDPFADDIDGLLDDSIPDLGTVQEPGGAPTTITNSPILNERLRFVYTYRARRTSVTVNASHSDQTRAEDGLEDTFIDAGVRLERELSRRLSLFTRVSWYVREPDQRRAIVRDSETGRFSLGARAQFGINTSATLTYQYTDRSSDIPNDEYQENRVILRFNYQL
ncbi:TIGR03016 family PEP-CTERM system-associated outer membrane protein [Parahaliea mediterranea]|uniref:TIGR03016 family PEP-CTERM system-associated outer membrane protein n=1 Tax=Parahaliea mediterranea TaxID=651086 RepID=A0A939DFT0_9GAMM|nr:TIGR03016 family PEP-CTERM system-associated outer membrane protein [Parahaliea mediterranea]MBN7797453.1 TIGR03016 family PEP-CTERM system-associated outer membrane protein [Parahaliea mediterranea]